MVAFDVESLFTNFPLEECIDLAELQLPLRLISYSDGVAMGSPLGSVLTDLL